MFVLQPLSADKDTDPSGAYTYFQSLPPDLKQMSYFGAVNCSKVNIIAKLFNQTTYSPLCV